MIPAHKESLQMSSALMPTLKRRLPKMDSCWVNPKGAPDKQGEKEGEVGGRNFPLPGAPVVGAPSRPASACGCCPRRSGEGRAGST